MRLIRRIYRRIFFFPEEKRFGLAPQMRRAAANIPTRPTKPQAKNLTRKFCRFLGIAKSSLTELQTLMLLSPALDFPTRENSKTLLNLSAEINKMLNGLLNFFAQKIWPQLDTREPLSKVWTFTTP